MEMDISFCILERNGLNVNIQFYAMVTNVFHEIWRDFK